ncbi:hypothetical protein CDL12_12338 [Handroanthus impetiginosus]|uniref:Uncharacterized protein n=1 Tax=Handroanthus impetiginosus TaxID=429701 RepID=A0A2G9HBY7_9LAMI|nr:hypothetical protein CDL12_12338 [Handroanthus impetiginosus]
MSRKSKATAHANNLFYNISLLQNKRFYKPPSLPKVGATLILANTHKKNLNQDNMCRSQVAIIPSQQQKQILARMLTYLFLTLSDPQKHHQNSFHITQDNDIKNIFVINPENNDADSLDNSHLLLKV